MATAGLCLGIAAIAFLFLPFGGIVIPILSIIGAALSGVAIKRAGASLVLAKISLALNLGALLIVVLWLILQGP